MKNKEAKQLEKMNLTKAHKYLGISFAKMTKLVDSGVIDCEDNVLDSRERLVKIADLDKLKEVYPTGKARAKSRS